MPAPNRRPPWSLRGVADAALWVGLAASFGLCLLTLAAFVGETHWLLEITTHFRPHYAAGLLACVAVHALARRFRLAAVFAVFALLNATVLAPRFAPRTTAPASAGAPGIKLLLANVLTSNRDHAALIALVEHEQPDVIALLEVNDEWLTALAPLALTHPHARRVPRSDNFGIALFSRLPLTDIKTVYLGPAEVPSISATFTRAGQSIRLLATHPLPPGSAEGLLLRDQQLAAIALWSTASSTPALVIGDLNCTPWSPAFRRLLKDGALHDTGKGLNPTWPVAPKWLRIPLDHCLATRSLFVRDHHIGPDIGSDHFPLLVTVALPPASP
ncbi:MAG: hypothetical protein K0R17_1773 [Rariglobus sp.]|jgi:endonuclease/exonuclease/phosphatase (EEP) superfamily protein YafD|nr:hypothetical protein [Rariglobus sp.]